MARALILACSRRKRQEPAKIPALTRYEGPTFQVLRRYLRSQPADPPDIWILSSEFGLIPADWPIPDYDYEMTAQRAEELRAVILERFRPLWERKPYTELFVCAARHYLHALEPCLTPLQGKVTLRHAHGSIGGRAAQLHDWLYGAIPQAAPGPRATGRSGTATLQGISLSTLPEDILTLARDALGRGAADARSFQAWYVPVGDERVGPKWLVSQLTGLPVSRFRTADARRVLTILGVEVRRA